MKTYKISDISIYPFNENGLIGMLYLFVGHIKAKYIFLVYN